MHNDNSVKGDEGIAIIGMACVFPQAPDVRSFWQNILGKVDAIGEPTENWGAERYLESGRISTQYGGYLKDLYRFNPQEFGIVPNSVDGGEPDQYLALQAARDALIDAGYFHDDYDHRDTGIVLGHSTYLHRGQGTLIQQHIVVDQTIELLRGMHPDLQGGKLDEIRELLKGKLPQSNADTAPGLVPNVMTGRIANRLNLKGPNYIIDAACASSLLAVNAAIDELRCGRSRMMLAGGVNASLPAEATVIFTQLGALSKRKGVRPFESGSDGTLLGEGLGVVVLKKVSDAIADGDRIYAVVRAVAQASDGRGQGLLAPSVEGETLAMQRAYTTSGIKPSSISLIEAHGTGIPLGDKTEIQSLKNIFGDQRDGYGSIAIGSVKSMISHCIPAAGIAGLIKVALSLHHKILPPTICDSINPELGIDKSPLYINKDCRPWIARQGEPRRAGINSFGFGGINAHAIVEEAPTSGTKPRKFEPWPVELSVFSAANEADLINQLGRVAAFIEHNADCPLADIAATLADGYPEGNSCRLAIVAKDSADLSKKIAQSIKRLGDDGGDRWATRNGIAYCRVPMEGKMAFIFPGEGSQYQGMFADLAMHFDEIRTWLDFWHSLYNEVPGNTRTDILLPPTSGLSQQDLQEMEQRLHDMDVGSEAVFVGGQAIFSLLKSFDIKPDVMLGHSSGESSALAASGAIASDDPQKLAEFIRELNAVYKEKVLEDGHIPTGALMAVGALPRDVIENQIAGTEILIAMDNCPNQVVLFGDKPAMDELYEVLTKAGGICAILPFDRGYHTPLFAEMSAAFIRYYESINLGTPSIPMYSCASADLFPESPQSVRNLAATQWSTKVRFRETVKKMHADGVSMFVEVGPSGNLSAFISDILAGQEYISLATNLRRRNGLDQLLVVLGFLFINGRYVNLQKLFDSRLVQKVDFDREWQAGRPAILLDNTMPVVRFNEQDREALRNLVKSPVATPLPESTNVGIENSAKATTGSSEEQGSTDKDVVMGEYFGVMRTFLEQQQFLMDRLHDQNEVAYEEEQTDDSYAPFLSAVSLLNEESLTAKCYLSVTNDNFLKDHVLSGIVSEVDPDLLGLACVPLMVSLEIMAQACAVLADSQSVRVVQNVKAFDWIALDAGEVVLDVQAEVIAEASLYRALITNAGNKVMSAEFSFEPQWNIEPLADLPVKRTSRWRDGELYETGMFHGPIFQSIASIDGWSDEGIDAALSPVSLDGFFSSGWTPNFVLNPVLLDAFGQIAAYWIAEQIGTDFNCFPSTIERIELLAECPQNIDGLTLRARQEPIDKSSNDVEAARSWNFECLDSSGQPVYRVKNLVNVHFSVQHRFYECRMSPRNGWLGAPHGRDNESGILLWTLPHLPDDFCAQSGGIFLRILAHGILGAEERDDWLALNATANRRREWLLGRACIKEGVRYWIYQHTGELLYPSDIIVVHDEYGAPYVTGWWDGDLADAPQVSLSHDRRMSLAAVAAPSQFVGVDVEQIGRIQQPELIMDALTENEQSLLRGLDSSLIDDRLLRLWCAKEAASKYQGTGLQGMPSAFEVSFIDDEWARAQVRNGETIVEVVVDRDGDSIVALAS